MVVCMHLRETSSLTCESWLLGPAHRSLPVGGVLLGGCPVQGVIAMGGDIMGVN
jgi:hypothetical protein